jgi:anti-sigma factor RsiW
MAECPDCAVEFARQKALRAALRTDLQRFAAPAGLAERISAMLRHSADPPSEAAPAAAAPQPGAVRRRLGMLWPVLASALAASLMTFWVMHTTPEERMTEAIVASHVRSLFSGHLTDLASADARAVKPWFAGKLDLAPPVRDLSDQGFELAGARLDYVDGHRTAALVYRRGAHILTLYVFNTPDAAATASDAVIRQGYAVCHWTRQGITFWAVSDLEPAELESFEDLVAGQA